MKKKKETPGPPPELKKLGEALKLATEFMMRAADGAYGPEFAQRARLEIERQRQLLIANHARLFERNATFRKQLKKYFTKRELEELMRESLEMNPTKKRYFVPPI